ncbi:MAG: phosphoglucosamine mutase [Planctomycetaceae bacterium]|nr:phosphoglucosamine mutase [Planctomycetales bacterium]MCB9941934.1 phosphoglucosamine mutase [Planctomycetaceae bacterium]
MKEPIISVSGLRGIIGESLSPELAMRFACAFATDLGEGPIVVTRDGRHTGRMLADAIRAGLCAVGRDVIDADVAATPTTGILVRMAKAAGGIQISASHNPPAYNGIKLFGSEGRVLTADLGERVVSRYRSGEISWVEHDRIGSVSMHSDTTSKHLELVLANVDVQRIRDQRFKVLLDSNHGAGSILGRKLLDALGCQITLLGGEPDGQFAHTPEPTAENLAGVRTSIVEAGAAVGFCQDPDADRLAVIDETGRYIGEEFTLVLCLDHVLSRTAGPVVTNCATSRMSEDIANKHGVEFYRSAVGEANVCTMMQEKQAAFGGEGNGGPIDPRVGFVRDSFVGMALILDAMAATGKSVSELADALPQYDIHKTKITLDRERIPAALDAIELHFDDATASRLDGLRLDWPDRWLLIRASNTEPIVRIIAEAPDAAGSRKLCDDAAKVIGAT